MSRASMLLLLALGGAALAQDGGAIAPAEFTRLHASLRGRQKWLTIPWRTKILEARAQAAKEGKPLFIWAMDGQTLGCT